MSAAALRRMLGDEVVDSLGRVGERHPEAGVPAAQGGRAGPLGLPGGKPVIGADLSPPARAALVADGDHARQRRSRRGCVTRRDGGHIPWYRRTL